MNDGDPKLVRRSRRPALAFQEPWRRKMVMEYHLIKKRGIISTINVWRVMWCLLWTFIDLYRLQPRKRSLDSCCWIFTEQRWKTNSMLSLVLPKLKRGMGSTKSHVSDCPKLVAKSSYNWFYSPFSPFQMWTFPKNNIPDLSQHWGPKLTMKSRFSAFPGFWDLTTVPLF